MFPADSGQRRLSVNALDMICAKQVKNIGSAEIIKTGDGAMVQGKKCCNSMKGKKGLKWPCNLQGWIARPISP